MVFAGHVIETHKDAGDFKYYDFRPLDITSGRGGLFVRPLSTYQPVFSKNIILKK